MVKHMGTSVKQNVTVFRSSAVENALNVRGNTSFTFFTNVAPWVLTLSYLRIVPVCGHDGKSYSNECLARCAGVKAECKGQCPCDNKKFDCTRFYAKNVSMIELFIKAHAFPGTWDQSVARTGKHTPMSVWQDATMSIQSVLWTLSTGQDHAIVTVPIPIPKRRERSRKSLLICLLCSRKYCKI